MQVHRLLVDLIPPILTDPSGLFGTCHVAAVLAVSDSHDVLIHVKVTVCSSGPVMS